MTPLVWLLAALAAGTNVGLAAQLPVETCVRLLVAGGGALVVTARIVWAGHRGLAAGVALPAVCLLGVALAGLHDAAAWAPEGLDLAALEAETPADPVRLVGVLRRDASLTPAGQVGFDLDVTRVLVQGQWRETTLGVRVTVGGERAPRRLADWTRGRRAEVTAAALRRPLPYRNFGVPDAERVLARQGLRLFATVKSEALVQVRPGPGWEEWAARVRAHVRSRIATHIRDADRAAIVTAILIGDRSRMAPETTRAMQHAGVYHVVAISGGNVALWLVVLVAVPRAAGAGVQLATTWAVATLLAVALVVDGGASVARAVAVAVLALAGRWWDVRPPARQVLALAGLVLLLRDPLVVHDAGLLLSFGAAATLVWLGSRTLPRNAAAVPTPRRWLVAAGVLAGSTLAIELVLLPVAARWFAVATAAGVLANLVAVPAMTLVQVAGLVLVPAADAWPALGRGAAALAAGAVTLLLRSADIVSVAPWLVREVPPPSTLVLVSYYVAGAAAVAAALRLVALRTNQVAAAGSLRCRLAACAVGLSGLVAVGCLAWMVGGGREASAPAPWTWPIASQWQHASWPHEPWLLVTVLDVGQGDATVVRFPSGASWLIDAGGSISESFDLGERVTTPALWALGHRRVARVVVTHAHPDHASGMPAVLRRLRPRELITGVPVSGEAATARLSAEAARLGAAERHVAAGEAFADGPVHVAVVHPERPDWERRRVRNDDSVVIWLRMGDVGILLPGDIGQAVEQQLATRIAAAPLTVLRLAHHGSASSTGPELLAALRPVLAIGSMGRANRFGHPSPAVTRRLQDAGVVLLRTDRDGAVQLATNGRVLLVRTAAGEQRGITTTTRRAWWPATPIPSDPATHAPATAPPPAGASRPRETAG